MKTLLLTITISLMSLNTQASDIDDQNIFAQTKLSFSSEIELANFIKAKKPNTFIYYNRLSDSLKKKVLRKHIDNNETDLTEIVLTVYRQK